MKPDIVFEKPNSGSLPPNIIRTSADGMVLEVKIWYRYNGLAALEPHIVKTGKAGYRVTCQDPEHGEITVRGGAQEVLERQLNPERANKFLGLLWSMPRSKENLDFLGFPGYERQGSSETQRQAEYAMYVFCLITGLGGMAFLVSYFVTEGHIVVAITGFGLLLSSLALLWKRLFRMS